MAAAKTNPKLESRVKHGALSPAEKKTIQNLIAKGIKYEAIAKLLNRSTAQVLKEIEKVTGVQPEQSMTLVEQLTARPEWKQFEKQFTEEELQEFAHQYVQIVSAQFKDDTLLPTEELQVFQLITLKIQIDRTLSEQKQALTMMAAATAAIDKMQKSDLSVQKNREQMLIASESYSLGRNMNKECTDRYKIYSDKQDKMMRDLRSTREQRVKVVENSGGSILGLVRLLMDEDKRKIAGQEAAMQYTASVKEKERLSQPHKYDDGVVDQPLLTPETVED
jgi:hypothetical protein